MRYFYLSILSFLIHGIAISQGLKKENIVTDFEVVKDSVAWKFSKHTYRQGNQTYLYFKATQPQDIVTFRLFPTSSLTSLVLLPSDDFTPLDTFRLVDSHWEIPVQFTDLTKDRFPVAQIKCTTVDKQSQTFSCFMLPCFSNAIYYSGDQQEIYQEEEKRIDLKAEDQYNLVIENRWIPGKDFDYRLTQNINGLLLQVKAHFIGYRNLTIPFKTTKPLILPDGTLGYELPPLVISFHAKPNRLEYVNVDKGSIFFNQEYKYSEEIQIDYNRNFDLNKTYRIEDTQEQGGNLVAEIFTVAPMGTNKLLCKMRTFSLHKATDGYLFIKEDDKSRFITNFNIIEKPRIDKVSIQSEGTDWSTSLVGYPGQSIELKIEGKGLERSFFQFDGMSNVRMDTNRITDESLFFSMKIPLNMPKKKATIFMNRKATPFEVSVKEYERPADFDFVSINYGQEKNTPINADVFNKPVLYDKLVKEINLQFNPKKIDEVDRLYGKQMFSVEIRLLNSRNELTDIQTIPNLCVCPGENSPRFAFYDQKDCKLKSLYLNEYLRQKTYNLEPFSQIIITLKHDELKYKTPGYTRKVTLILKRDYFFDIQFSFPTGLFIKAFNQAGVGNLTGISTSVLANFSFYDQRRIGQLLPYSVGVGFLGVNAFSFSDAPDRDAGIVALATLNPLNRNGRFQIPIYLGGGYLIKANTMFLVFGPGIQFRF